MAWSSSEAIQWSSGDHLVLRQVCAGRVWAAFPVTAITDSAEHIAMYMAPGTTFMHPDCTRKEHLRVLASGQWNLVRGQWYGQHHVWVSVPGEACSVWAMWTDPDWEHLGWKVNPEIPMRRTGIGFDTTDHVLDAVVRADLSSWAWKDEDEFAEAMDLGLFDLHESELIRQETLRVAKEVLTTRRSQMQQWARWRPPEGWEIPTLTPGWEVV